jgi:hypothetical protein
MLKIFCNLSLLINFNNSKTYQPAAASDTFFKDWATGQKFVPALKAG